MQARGVLKTEFGGPVFLHPVARIMPASNAMVLVKPLTPKAVFMNETPAEAHE
jgi:hypothetical protein